MHTKRRTTRGPSWSSSLYCQPWHSVTVHRLGEFLDITNIQALGHMCQMVRLSEPGFMRYFAELHPQFCSMNDKAREAIHVPPSRGDQTPPPHVRRVFVGGVSEGFREVGS